MILLIYFYKLFAFSFVFRIGVLQSVSTNHSSRTTQSSRESFNAAGESQGKLSNTSMVLVTRLCKITYIVSLVESTHTYGVDLSKNTSCYMFQ